MSKHWSVVRVMLAGVVLSTALWAVMALATQAPIARADTPVSGSIIANTTWTLANSPYVLFGAVAISGGVTLTIEPGVVVKFGQDLYLWPQNGSTLIAQGTPSQPITFTADLVSPTAGYWRYLYLDAAAKVRLSHCDIGYAGSINGRGVDVYGPDVQVSNCRIHHTSGDGVFLNVNAGSPSLENTLIDQNSGAAIHQAGPAMTPRYSNLTLANNGTNAVVMEAGYIAQTTLDGPGSLNGKPFVFNGSIDVQAGTTLTIAPGTTVRLSNGGTYLWAQNGGTLIAQGTPNQPITFTANLTTPTPGYWGDLYLDATSKVRLAYCDVGYAGGYNGSGVDILGSDIQISNCRIHHTGGDGVRLENSANSPSLTNTLIDYNTGAAIHQLGPAMTPHYSNLTLANNGSDAVVIEGGSFASTMLDGPGSLNGKPFVLNGGMIVAAGITLTVTPGTSVRMGSAASMWAQNGGTLIALGTAAQPITFTANLTTPTAGYWGYFYLDATARVRLAHCDVGYGGSSNGYGIDILGSDTLISNCRIHDTAADGIRVNVSGAAPSLSCNRIDNNTFGLRNVGSTTVDARLHWWGAASGPNNPAQNPGGTGNGVSDNVLFQPWLSVPLVCNSQLMLPSVMR